MRDYLTGKCPKCCPEGGAIFDDMGTTKVCRNCGYEQPRRVIKPREGLTESQIKAIQRLSQAFGGTHTVEKIGRKAFVKFENQGRNWIQGTLLAGTIGAAGKLDLTLYRLGGDAKITSDIHVRVYLT